MSKERICNCCGSVIDNDDYYVFDDEVYCDDCFYENFRRCNICGNVEPVEDMRWVEGEERDICEDCADRFYTECYRCGELVNNNDAEYLEGDYYCHDCFEDIAYYCEECDEYVSEVNWNFDENCCRDCASNHRIIKEYHSHHFYKVGFTDYENNIFHKGVELEIENICEDIENDELAEMLGDKYEHIVFERDGSLDNGFEIITQPHTFEMFNKIPWDDIFHICKNNGFRSHDTSTCGLHIHYSREFFGLDRNTQEDNIGKLIAFYERHLDDILRLSRRTWGNYQRWARGYDTEGDIEKCKECAKGRNDRYRYINLTKSRTIEFRLGRGTLNYHSFMAWNNLHDCLIKNVKNVSYEDIDNLSLWFDGIDADTIEYMKKKCAFNDFV